MAREEITRAIFILALLLLIGLSGCGSYRIEHHSLGSRQWVIYRSIWGDLNYESNWEINEIGGFDFIPGSITPTCVCGKEGWVYLNRFGNEEQARQMMNGYLEQKARE